ncbi:MAG: adenylate cyclase [Planctomycetota bacterium]|jgi:adenylate cyclase
MFADIVGSTRLYEILGDEIAEELISSTLKQLSAIIVDAGGTIIKNIGDEVMSRFPEAEQAVIAARQMHEFLTEKTAPSRDYKLAIRVGAHQGTIIENDGDIFGDAVNLAARIAGLARGGKTLISAYTHEQLPPGARERCQHFTQTIVKGKEQPIDIYDVVWEQTDELTRIVGNSAAGVIGNVLSLQYQDNTIKLTALGLTAVSIGRGKDCDLIIPSAQASRQHCRIECNRGKFMFSDNSANGSYVSQNNIELFFHQESIPLIGGGLISLGEPIERNKDFLIKYSIGISLKP